MLLLLLMLLSECCSCAAAVQYVRPFVCGRRYMPYYSQLKSSAASLPCKTPDESGIDFLQPSILLRVCAADGHAPSGWYPHPVPSMGAIGMYSRHPLQQPTSLGGEATVPFCLFVRKRNNPTEVPFYTACKSLGSSSLARDR